MSEITVLGKIEIIATPTNNPDVSSVYMSSSLREDVVHADTRADENLDQFAQRLRGMLKALYNAPVKQEKKKEPVSTAKTGVAQ